MSGAEIVFPILTETKKQKNPLCSHLSDLIVRVVLKGVGIVSRTPAWLNLMSSMPSTEETTGTKANTDTKSTRRVWRHLCSLIFVLYFVRCFLFPCFQVEGSELQPVLRHDSGWGHPLPSGHPETLQDYHEHEWDPGTRLVSVLEH